ncbi:protein PNS1-like [Bidens hawaiensis]|uniref:protein PNS1-like n=1 Tax=Bidens hawaiensis TaxID=980011 RepID=UPI00404A68CD
MGVTEPVLERESEDGDDQNKQNYHETKKTTHKDLEKGEMGFEQQQKKLRDLNMSRMQRLSATNPLRIVMDSATRVPPTPTPNRGPTTHHPPPQPQPQPQPQPPPPPPPSHPSPPPPTGNPRSIPTPIPIPIPIPSPIDTTPTPQPSMATLNSRKYTNKLSLFLFALHFLIAVCLVFFLVFKGIQGLLQHDSTRKKEKRLINYFLPQVEAASLLSITLAFAWQKSVRVWPHYMVHFILWSSFLTTLSTGILLICFQRPATDGVGVVFIFFAIGNGLYSCWVTQRTKFCSKIFLKALEPVSKFPDINQPTYWMLGIGFIWMSIWILAVIGALNFYFPPLVIILLVLSLLWTAEVMRNVANLTISRVIALFYLRGIQSNTQFCFQRALSKNLGSACLGSLFVPTIEALRIVARGLNLLEREDEFMFSCAHCCLRVMETIFRYGNGWAYVQIAAYGKGFVKASQDTWELFEKRDMEMIVDSDITTAICFLTGVCSGSICVIVVAAWTFKVHIDFTATISLLAFIVGYLMMRIAMALPHACVSCYYVCYAENPDNKLFDKTIPDRLELIKSNRDVVVPTPRVPPRFRR